MLPGAIAGINKHSLGEKWEANSLRFNLLSKITPQTSFQLLFNVIASKLLRQTTKRRQLTNICRKILRNCSPGCIRKVFDVCFLAGTSPFGRCSNFLIRPPVLNDTSVDVAVVVVVVVVVVECCSCRCCCWWWW